MNGDIESQRSSYSETSKKNLVLINLTTCRLNPLEVQLDYPFLSIEEELKNYVPPNDLVEFLSKGKKPIYFGYGSMHSFGDVKSRVSIWLEVMKSLPDKHRALFSGVEE